jgi:hypothetical protein
MACEPWAWRSQCGETALLMPAFLAVRLAVSDNRMQVNLNYFGTPVSSDYLARLGDGGDQSNDMQYRSMAQLLGAEPQHLPREVLKATSRSHLRSRTYRCSRTRIRSWSASRC